MMDEGMVQEFSWETYRLDGYGESIFENLLSEKRLDLLKTFRDTRIQNSETLKVINQAIDYAMKMEWENTQTIWKSLAFILQRDSDIKIKCENIIEAQDDEKIARSAIEACGMIFEVYQKIEVVAGGPFIKAATSLQVDPSVMKQLNESKKPIHQFFQQHAKSLKHVRDSAGAHFDIDNSIYAHISNSIGRQATLAMIVDFSMKINALSKVMQDVMTQSTEGLKRVRIEDR